MGVYEFRHFVCLCAVCFVDLPLTHLTVCNLSKHSKGFLHVGLLLGGQVTVMLQNTQLHMALSGLWLQLLQQLLCCSHSQLFRLLLLSGVPNIVIKKKENYNPQLYPPISKHLFRIQTSIPHSYLNSTTPYLLVSSLMNNSH